MKISSVAFPLALALLPLMVAADSARPGPSTVPVRNCLTGAAGSFLPTISADGRIVAFLSQANNLVANDDRAPWLDAFVRDLESQTTRLATPSFSGNGGGNADTTELALAGNGRFLAFASAASNLVAGDDNESMDVFVRDLDAAITTLVSVDRSGRSPGNPAPALNAPLSGRPLISSNGQWVVFESRATNLVALLDANDQPDLFVRNLTAGTTHLVSASVSGNGTGNGASHSGSLAPDGRFVAFVSAATDLVPGATNGSAEIYVRDLTTGQTVWASMHAARHAPAEAAYTCFHPALSADGRSVVFKMSLTGRQNALVLHHHLPSQITTQVTDDSWADSWPQVSANGRFVACEDAEQVVVWDRDGPAVEWMSVAADGGHGANLPAHTPVLSVDGFTVVFLSRATNLVAGATNECGQIYVRDRQAGTTTLVSMNSAGRPGVARLETVLPALSNDGRRVAFESADGTLADDDWNRASDVFVRDLTSGELRLISERHPDHPALTGVAASEAAVAAVSADGMRIGFTSLDGYLTPGDTNGWQDAFIWDRTRQRPIPVSVETGDVFSSRWFLFARNLTLSAGGLAAAFYWDIPDRWSVHVDITSPGDIYFRDFDNDLLLPVNVTLAGTLIAEQCFAPMISPDGRLVAFSTRGFISYLVEGGRGGGSETINVFYRDMIAGTNNLVSAEVDGYGPFGFHSTNITFSPDGLWLLFASSDPWLTTNSVYGVESLFARNLAGAFTVLVSVGPEGDTEWGYAEGACFSGDSRRIAFVSNDRQLTVRDLNETAGRAVRADARAPSLNGNGRYLACESRTDASTPTNILCIDLETSQAQLVSRGFDGGGGSQDSFSPAISADGRYIIFASRADNLVVNDGNRTTDVFVHDRLLNITLLASANYQGTGSGNGPSDHPIMAANGRTVVFQSFATDLVPGDYNLMRDVFVLDLAGADTDADGLDDEWEWAYFESLSRDGAADFDQDDASDAAEFRAGTDPTNAGSVLRVLTVSSPGTAATSILWASVPGHSYRVECRDEVAGAAGEPGEWLVLADAITAAGTTGTVLDPDGAAHPHRFYRVVLR